MTTEQPEFHPVIPNITDDSMRGATPSTITDDTHESDAGLGVPAVTLGSKVAWGRRIIIGVLIAVIVILVILLVYQMYKYYTTEVHEPPTEVHRPPTEVHRPPTEVHKLKKCGIPDSVKNLDDALLSQYIKKTDNKKNTEPGNKMDHGKNLAYDNVENTVDTSEMDKLIDDTLYTQEKAHIEEVIPTRDDILNQMHKDMDAESNTRAQLETINENNTIDIIDSFMDDGCKFELTKGKNAGGMCGRRLSSDTRCGRHEGK